MILPIIVIAESVAGQIASADAKRRQSLGLPPAPPSPPPLPPTFGDKVADLAIWALILLPGVAFAAIIGGGLFIIAKIAFAREGISFP